MARRGIYRERILLLLLGGLVLSFQRSPKGQLRVLKAIRHDWKEINDRALREGIRDLYRSKLLKQKGNKDGTVTFVLSEEGKEKALTYNLDNITVKKHRWDKKWRIVIFDVPEKLKRVRDALGFHLKRLEFKELQHSVFVLPYECRDEIEYLTEFYNARRFVRFIEADYIDNELDIKHAFNLL